MGSVLGSMVTVDDTSSGGVWAEVFAELVSVPQADVARRVIASSMDAIGAPVLAIADIYRRICS